MRPPRYRLRTLMLAVAIVAAAIDLVARRERFRMKASRHTFQAHEGATVISLHRAGLSERLTPRGRWHRERAREFERAAARPWLPVAPDPPEPE
jgi:hypothetical protein